MAVYSVTAGLTKTGGTLDITENLLYGGVRFGGVRILITPRPGARVGALGWVRTAPDVLTATALQQEIDMTYDGVVVGHLSISAEPDPDIGHSSSIQTNWNTDIPFTVDTQRLN